MFSQPAVADQKKKKKKKFKSSLLISSQSHQTGEVKRAQKLH